MAVMNNIRITPAGSADTVAFRMYYEPVGNPVTLQSPYVTLITFPPGQPPVDQNGDVVIDLNTIPGISLDGNYDVAVRAVDDADRISGGFDVADVPFDFVAPGAPVNVEFF